MVLNNIKSKQRGFTIVELLVVIVVIGILAAITIVSYTGVTDRAKAAQAASNASSVASVAEAYFADCAAYPNSGQLSAPTACNGITPVTKLPSSVTIGTPSLNSLDTTNFTSKIIYVLKDTTGVCIANYDPTYTTATLPNYTKIKVTLLGTATGFSANPNEGAATCS